MRFEDAAPGNLAVEGTVFYGDWFAPPAQAGHTQAEVEAYVSSALNDSRGWGQAGITFRHREPSVSADSVSFQMVDTFPAGDAVPGQVGLTYPRNGSQPPYVLLAAGTFGDEQNLNHEAGHAFLTAAHSATTDSIMYPVENYAAPWPTVGDIAAVETWLATYDPSTGPANPASEGGSIHWFPADLSSYITRWPVPAGAEARLTASVLSGAPALLRSVYSADYSAMLAGDYRRFSPSADAYQEGFLKTNWRAVPASGELFVGVVAHVDTDSDLAGLVVGLTEVQIR